MKDERAEAVKWKLKIELKCRDYRPVQGQAQRPHVLLAPSRAARSAFDAQAQTPRERITILVRKGGANENQHPPPIEVSECLLPFLPRATPRSVAM